ncbi:MAG: hypothetical protein WC548_04220 [Candidatus Pacearchaeota archaeon]
MNEVIFKGVGIQKGHRIKIPKAIVDTMDLKEGQGIKIKFDVKTKKMIIEVENGEK